MQEKNKKVVFTSRLSEKYLDALRHVAEVERRPLTNQLAIILEDWFKENKKKYPEIEKILS